MYMIWTSQRSAYRGADGYRPTLTACAMKTTATPNGPTKMEDPSVSAKVATLAPYEDGFGPVSEGYGDWAEKQTKLPSTSFGQSAQHAKPSGGSIRPEVEKGRSRDGTPVLQAGVAYQQGIKPKITDSSPCTLFNMSASADEALTDEGTM